MHKFVSALLFLHILSGSLTAQVIPAENSRLNYRIVGFSFPNDKTAVKYCLEIASGTHFSADSFRKNIVVSATGDTNKIIAEVPSFGKDYTWRVSYIYKGKKQSFDRLHHFIVGTSPQLDTNAIRITILQHALSYKDAYFFLDGTATLYNMEGHPVWYLPAIKGIVPGKDELRDFRLTPQGTITFLSRKNIYEVAYDGTLLWKGPDIDNENIFAHFHHQLSRLNNGHYMVMGNDSASVGRFGSKMSDATTGTTVPKSIFGTILEYAQNGDLIWSWNSAAYFKLLDPAFLYSCFDQVDSTRPIDVHANSFYYDEKTAAVYVSFRNINSILQVKYPEGNVIGVYGRLQPTRAEEQYFCGQHSIKITRDGNLLLFNNNTCHPGAMPGIVALKRGKNTLEKVWEYSCDVTDVIEKQEREDPKTKVSPQTLIFPSGGNVIELPDKAYFASMCGDYGKIFIVGPDKKILWSATSQKWNEPQKKWEYLVNYKASIICNPLVFMHLIWNESIDHSSMIQ